jgi:hypothetical protein
MRNLIFSIVFAIFPHICCLSQTLKILPNTFFKGGELLTMQLRYGFIVGGKVTLELNESSTDSNKNYYLKGTAKTIGLADKLFQVRDI